MRTKKLSILLLAGILFVQACAGGTNDTTNKPGDEVRSDKLRIESPQIDANDLSAQVSGNTQFALDMYQQLRKETDQDIFFSPHSIEIALAMTFAGAKNGTESAMADTLHFEFDQSKLHPLFNHIDLELISRAEIKNSKGSDGQGFRLNVLNSIWGRKGYSFLETFLDVLAENYGAGLRLLDFINDALGATKVINQWVEDATESRIKDLIPEGLLSADTVMVLVNAIYFNAAWAIPFEPENTKDGEFHPALDESITVPMMFKEDELNFAEGEGFQAVELPYEGDQLAMWVLVPELGKLDEFEQSLNVEFLASVEATKQNGIVKLSMPRWELKGETISIKKILTQLGMGIAFDRNLADFSGMNGFGELFIFDVLHQAFVKVNEQGTEAAAATAVIVNDTSVPPEGPEIVLDRPFVYLIKDIPTGQVLFVGRVVNPQ